MPESKRFLELIEQMRDIHKRKNAGYAGKDTDDPWANFRMSNMLGVSPFKGCLVRMSDKFIRVANLSKDEENDQVGEPITDTLLDLACYSLIAICLYEDANKESVNINIEFDAESLAEKLTEAELHIPKDVKAEHGFPDLGAVRGRPISPKFLERLSKALDQYEEEETRVKSDHSSKVAQAVEALKSLQDYNKRRREQEQ